MPTVSLHTQVASNTTPLTFDVAFRSPTANAWAHSFLRTLHSALRVECPQQASALVMRVARTAQLHFRQHPHPVTGREACIAAGVCALLVACYRVVGEHVGDGDHAMALTEHCLTTSYHTFVERICVPMVRNRSAGAANLRRMNFAHWSAHLYPGVVSVDGSGYAAFFLNHGFAELSGMLRSVDTAWRHVAAELSRGVELANRDAHSAESGFSPFRFAVQAPHTPPKPPSVMQLVVSVH
jgi:hypothetical protein